MRQVSSFACVRVRLCHTRRVRWEALFDDLEAQLDTAEAAELGAEVSDRTRRELARLGLDDRARAAVGATVVLGLGPAGTAQGVLTRVGAGWWLLAGAGAQLLVPTGGIGWVTGLPAPATEPESVGVVAARLTLAYALRGIARDRSPVTVVLRDGGAVTGTIDRVGADFIDVAEHAPNEARRPASVTGARAVAFGAIAVVRTS